MPITQLKRLEFKFPSLMLMSAFMRALRLHERDSLAEAARAHFGHSTVTVTLPMGVDGTEVRLLAVKLGGKELLG